MPYSQIHGDSLPVTLAAPFRGRSANKIHRPRAARVRIPLSAHRRGEAARLLLLPYSQIHGDSLPVTLTISSGGDVEAASLPGERSGKRSPEAAFVNRREQEEMPFGASPLVLFWSLRSGSDHVEPVRSGRAGRASVELHEFVPLASHAELLGIVERVHAVARVDPFDQVIY